MLAGAVKVDAITGDWLSEYNMGTRALQKGLQGAAQYEPGFLHSLQLAIPLYKSYPCKLKFVVNAGGGNPRELALQVARLLDEHGMQRKIAYITGDDVMSQLDTLDVQPLNPAVEDFTSFRKSQGRILSANVYIGSAGIQSALRQGADFVIVGRCTDASPVRLIFRTAKSASMIADHKWRQVIGLCTWWHKWTTDHQEQLAGALLTGHLIECGCYVVSDCSENYLREIYYRQCGGGFAGYQKMGNQHFDLSFPIAEISSDGTAIIQKQPDQKGM